MADAANPFDLEKRKPAGPVRQMPKRLWTEEEQAEKLVNYSEIDSEFWEAIKYGTYIRYYLKTGEFKAGGLVSKNPFDFKPHDSNVEKRFIKLHNAFSDKAKDYIQWTVAYEDIAKIYIKPDASVLMVMKTLETAVRGLNENIRKLAEHSKKLDARIALLEKKV